jgi:hypothetical protein
MVFGGALASATGFAGVTGSAEGTPAEVGAIEKAGTLTEEEATGEEDIIAWVVGEDTEEAHMPTEEEATEEGDIAEGNRRHRRMHSLITVHPGDSGTADPSREKLVRRERIVVGQQKARNAGNIILPDVRPLAVFLNPPESNVVLWSHRAAGETLRKIVRRQRWNSIKEGFEVDVPDLDRIAQGFPKEEQALLMDFWAVYESLVRHFLPKAKVQPYFFKGGVRGGIRLNGWGWFSPE